MSGLDASSYAAAERVLPAILPTRRTAPLSSKWVPVLAQEVLVGDRVGEVESESHRHSGQFSGEGVCALGRVQKGRCFWPQRSLEAAALSRMAHGAKGLVDVLRHCLLELPLALGDSLL